MPWLSLNAVVIVLFGLAKVGAMAMESSSDALALDDEDCLGGDSGEGACALSALQRRAQRRQTGAACDADGIGRMLQTVSPACAARCPGLCSAALPSVAAVEAAGRAASGLCAGRAQLACALEHTNAKVCAPVLLEMQAWLGDAVPKSVNDLEALCEGEAAAVPQAGMSIEVSLEQRAAAGGGAFTHAARAAMMDAVLAGKEADPRCEKAPEGQTCVSKNQWIYCSNHKRLSAGTTDCETHIGHMSLCRKDGVGLSHDYCDDPFCRNGGAFGGQGSYCHNDAIVFCKGTDPPHIVDSCSDKQYTDYNGQQQTSTGHCGGSFPDPYCYWDDPFNSYNSYNNDWSSSYNN